MANEYQTFITLMREAQHAQDSVDSYDLDSTNAEARSVFEGLCREAVLASGVLVGFAHTHAKELMAAFSQMLRDGK